MKVSNNIIDNKILNYNDFNYNSPKVVFSDYVIDKHNIVHNMLYEEALEEMIKDKGYDKNNYKFIEIKKEKYYEPSTVYVKKISYPFDIERISLKPYWNKYQYVNENKQISNDFLNDDVNINALEVIEINYVNNKVKFRSKNTGEIIIKDLSFINDDTKYNLDEMSLKNTFSYKLHNKIYGK